MAKKLTTETFIEKAINIHGDKYDYSNSNYIGSKLKVEIICKKHGIFKQQPNSHLNGNGCPVCATDNTKISLSLGLTNFIDKANQVHNFKYDYSLADYVNSKTKINIVCPIHQEFKQLPLSHLNGRGCAECGNASTGFNQRLTQESFVNRSLKIHNGKFNYDKVIFETTSSKVIITCPIHGDFLQTPNNHLNGHGCFKCIDRVSNTVGFTKIGFIKKYKTQQTTLYVVALKNKTENFIKIGITGQKLSVRWIGQGKYKITPFLQIKNSPENVWDLEQWLHKQIEKFQYMPAQSFPGHTECFDFRAMMDIQELLLNNPIIKIKK